MIKAEVNNKFTKLEACGSLPTLGSDITHIMHALISNMEEDVAHDFKLSFTMAFLSGLLFDTDADEMKELTKEAVDVYETSEKSKTDTIDKLLDELNSLRKQLKQMEEDKKNETK